MGIKTIKPIKIKESRSKLIITLEWLFVIPLFILIVIFFARIFWAGLEFWYYYLMVPIIFIVFGTLGLINEFIMNLFTRRKRE